jgi:thermostable 8-oxoguanine DNA glycosylase
MYGKVYLRAVVQIWFMKIENLDKYIELYGVNYLFNVIGPEVRKRGHLSFDEFYEICMWKSARQKQRYLKNKGIVEEASKKAFAEKDERQQMEMLCKLDGVGIPTASALLTVVWPEEYAVIDIRCLEILEERFGQKLGKSISINTWQNYLSLMRKWAEENKTTPRKLDMALFAMHREWLKETGRNLY